MKLRIQALLQRWINPDSDPEPTREHEPDDLRLGPEEAKRPSIALCSPYSYPQQWALELSKPCYCGLPAIWLDFYRGRDGGTTAVGTCQHHRGVTEWVHMDDGPVRAFWDPCPSCPPGEGSWMICRGHIVVGDKLHTVIR